MSITGLNAIQTVAHQFEIEQSNKNEEALMQALAARVNELIASDFDRLVFVLYKVDVNEEKLKHLLKENQDTDAGMLIAQLLVERERQKIDSRARYKGTGEHIDEDEKW